MDNNIIKIFDNFFENKPVEKINSNYNVMQVTKDTFEISISVPGFTRKDLNITLNDNILKIAGKKSQEVTGSNPTYIYKGVETSKFENNFSLGKRLSILEANLKDGILSIILKDNNTNEESNSQVK
ncbi:Hsp20 family protein [Rickettsiales bacterium LUAb2]